MTASDTFFDLVKTQFAPVLRTYGFRGSGRTFRRQRGDCVHIVNLQTSASGGRCAVNLAIAFTFMDGVAADRVNQEDCDFRRRLCPHPGQTDYWWDFGDGAATTQENVKNLVDSYRRNGDSFFNRFGQLPGDYAAISVQDLRAPSRDNLPGGATEVRYALVLAQLWLHLQQPAKAAEFVSFGLEVCKPMAVGARTRLREIQKRIEQGGGEVRG